MEAQTHQTVHEPVIQRKHRKWAKTARSALILDLQLYTGKPLFSVNTRAVLWAVILDRDGEYDLRHASASEYEKSEAPILEEYRNFCVERQC